MENKTVQLQNLKMFISNTGRNTRILGKRNSLLKQQIFCVLVLTPYATAGYWYE